MNSLCQFHGCLQKNAYLKWWWWWLVCHVKDVVSLEPGSASTVRYLSRFERDLLKCCVCIQLPGTSCLVLTFFSVKQILFVMAGSHQNFPHPHISFVVLAVIPQEYLNETQFCNCDPLTYFLIHEWMLPYHAYLFHQTLAQATQIHKGLVEAGFYGVFHFGCQIFQVAHQTPQIWNLRSLNLPACNWDTFNWNVK